MRISIFHLLCRSLQFLQVSNLEDLLIPSFELHPQLPTPLGSNLPSRLRIPVTRKLSGVKTTGTLLAGCG